MDTGNMIFVFGSNEAGIHGAGAAKYAMNNKGACWGLGVGLAGHSYAIPTKDKNLRTLSLDSINKYVQDFIIFCEKEKKSDDSIKFQITRIGCGLAGCNDSQIAPMFFNAPSNCFFDEAWKPYLGENHQYWGTF